MLEENKSKTPPLSMSLLGITPHHDFFDIEDIPTRPLMFFLFWRLDFSLVMSVLPILSTLYVSCLASCCLLLSLIHLASYTIISYYILSALRLYYSLPF